MRIGIDAMGGDNAPYEIVKGAVESLANIKSSLVLFGIEEEIQAELDKYDYNKSRIEIVHTSEVIENDDKPVKAIKKKADSSMVVGLKTLRRKDVDAFVSAGNTGALMAGALFKVGRIKGIDRPALCSLYPTIDGVSVLTDAGANADCKPRNLIEFALMGAIYSKNVLGVKDPRVGLLNIGVEETKGNSLYIETHEHLKEVGFNFIGNIEARELPSGDADVIVCDGFTGNVALKLTEGVATLITKMLKDELMSNAKGKVGSLIIKSNLKKFKKKMDYSEYGGAPLLGVKGLVVKAHGSSNSNAFMNAVKYAEIGIESEVVAKIHSEILRIYNSEEEVKEENI